MRSLRLIDESKVARLLPGHDGDDELEASGVLARGGQFFVVFDNLVRVARIETSLSRRHDNALLSLQHRHPGYPGYEDIAYNERDERFYLLVEAVEHENDFRSEVVECSDTFEWIDRQPLPFSFKDENKGFEGLAYVRRRGDDHLLALCEGNRCKGGRRSDDPGRGMAKVFRRDHGAWRDEGTLRLPTAVRFADYAGLAVSGDQIAVVSQASSRLWIGALHPSDWRCQDDGVVYEFPRDGDGEVVYCNVEGISWWTPGRVVVVSDRIKGDNSQPARCRTKDQMIHVFALPD